MKSKSPYTVNFAHEDRNSIGVRLQKRDKNVISSRDHSGSEK